MSQRFVWYYIFKQCLEAISSAELNNILNFGARILNFHTGVKHSVLIQYK